jgi:hypothetical protein
MNAGGAIAFIGLGVMGEPMCRNLAARSGRPVLAHDLRPEPLKRLAEVGVRPAPSLGAAVEAAETVILSLPGEPEVRKVCLDAGGVLEHARAGQVVIDTSTAPPALARELAERIASTSPSPTRRSRARARPRPRARSRSWSAPARRSSPASAPCSR